MSNIEKSSNWYFTVNEYCKSLEVIYNVPLIKIAGIFSALSPNNTVKTNIISLERFLLHKGNCKVTTFNGQKNKALQILNSEDSISVDDVKQILRGKKTCAFFDNIFQPEVSREVTIDLWMIRYFKIDGSLTDKKYDEAADKVRDLADKIGVLPHRLQAKIWVEIRGQIF